MESLKCHIERKISVAWLISLKWEKGSNASWTRGSAREESKGAFRQGLKYDIIPCKAKDFMVQKRRFGLGNLIQEGNNGLCPKSIRNVRFIIHSIAKNIIIRNFALLSEKIKTV